MIKKITLLLFLITLFGCSSTAINDKDPEALYKDAEEDISDSRYIAAHDKLRTLKNKFPYSNYSKLAQLRIADVYFLEESFEEAASNYQLFCELHPNHERAAYALFRAGESYYKATPTNIHRDLTTANKAINAYRTFLGRFPSAPESKDAKERISEMETTLAEKELIIANFYMREDQFKSAEKRYKKILDLYPQTKSAGEATLKLKEIEESEKK